MELEMNQAQLWSEGITGPQWKQAVARAAVRTTRAMQS